MCLILFLFHHCSRQLKKIDDGDEIEFDLERGVVVNHTKGEEYRFPAFPDNVIKIIEAGGLINYVKEEIGRK